MKRALLLTAATAGTTACTAPPVRPSLSSDQTLRQVPAIVENRDADPDVLLRKLDDPDAAVRAFAAEALQRRFGRDFGYRFYQDSLTRRPAVQRWRDFLDTRPRRIKL